MDMIVILMLVAVATTFQVQEHIASCPDSWTTFHNSCYKYVETSTNWYYANIICASAVGHLVTIESESENTFVTRLAKERRNISVWIGLSDLMEEERFVWHHNQQVPIYSKWLLGQPDDYSVGEDCVLLWSIRQYLWNDGTCSEALPSVCERN